MLSLGLGDQKDKTITECTSYIPSDNSYVYSIHVRICIFIYIYIYTNYCNKLKKPKDNVFTIRVPFRALVVEWCSEDKEETPLNWTWILIAFLKGDSDLV